MRSERLFRALLKLYPVAFRREYEKAMAQYFCDQLRAADSAGKRLRLWLHTFADFAHNVPARHWEVVQQAVMGRVGKSGSCNAYGEGARRSLYLACLEASSFHSQEMSLEQLLLGTLRSDDEFATSLLGFQGITMIAQAIGSGRPVLANALPGQERESDHLSSQKWIGPMWFPLNRSCKKALAQARKEAHQSHQQVGTRHIVSAILKQANSRAACVLREHVLDWSCLQSER